MFERVEQDNRIMIRQDRDETRLLLPPRTGLRGLGIALVFGALFSIGFSLFWMHGPVSDVMRESGSAVHNVFSLAFGLAGLPPLGIGLGLLVAGLSVLRGRNRTEIVVSRSQFKAVEHFGPLWWSWKRPVAAIRTFVVADSASLSTKSSGTAQATPAFMVNRGALKVEGTGMKPLLVAPFYSLEQLKELGEGLAGVLNRHGGVSAESVVRVVEAAVQARELAEVVLPQPTGSKIQVKELPDGLEIFVPATGVWKGSKGLFAFALIWNGFVTFMAVGMGISMIRGNVAEKAKADSPLVFLLFLIPFLAIGTGILLAAVNMGRRTARIEVGGGRLSITTTGIFGTKVREIAVPEIAAVRMGPSGMEVNNRPVMELQIQPRTGKKIGLLTQCNQEELAWLASLLRQRLQVPAVV